MVSGGLLRRTDASAATPAAVLHLIAASTPLRRAISPPELADAVLFFASPWSRAVTGQNLIVDGGLVNGCAGPRGRTAAVPGSARSPRGGHRRRRGVCDVGVAGAQILDHGVVDNLVPLGHLTVIATVDRDHMRTHAVRERVAPVQRGLRLPAGIDQ